jgi:hypothetical protein
MASEEQNADKLRQYLRVLKPEARALLVAELERGVLRGEGLPGTDLVLQELRTSMREAAQQTDRIGNPARLFFVPVQPFLVDDQPEFPHDGRIGRATLTAIWEWICRDLAPEPAKAYVAEVSRLTLAGDDVAAEAAARAFQDRVVQLVHAALMAAQADDKAKRKLSVQIGTPRAIEDVHRLATMLRARDTIAALSTRIPASIKSFGDDQIGSIKPLIDTIAGQRDVFTFAVVLVMSRLQNPWQLIRFATRAANTDDASKVADSTYAVTVTIVLQEIERLVRALNEDLKRGQAMARPTLLKEIHDAARGLRTEIDFSVDSPWARRLAAIRSEISDLLKAELESVPGRVRRLLRIRPARDIVPGSSLDQSDVADTESLIAFLGLCRSFASELAINEMTLRAWSELQHYLETNIQPLLDTLRTAGGSERNYRQSQVEAAVRFCGKVFGQDYAGLLGKAADLAAAGDRKAARA